MAKYIPLTQGKIAIVNDEDYELVSQYKWYALKREHTFYVVRKIYKISNNNKSDKNRTNLYLHRFLTDFQKVDHINGNGLDNRKQNLRNSTNRQNGYNRRKQLSGTSSIYKGVRKFQNAGTWGANIKIDGTIKYLGSFI